METYIIELLSESGYAEVSIEASCLEAAEEYAKNQVKGPCYMAYVQNLSGGWNE